MILFLDFDGVLHPDAVYLERSRPVLRAEGELFMWMDVLSAALADQPQVRIVLSTSWARVFGFSRARDYLPAPLRPRVIGATWHSQMGKHQDASHQLQTTWWDKASRYQQIKRWVSRANCIGWIAIDDQTEGWGEEDRGRLVQTDSATGLGALAAQQRLLELLRGTG